jgi:hypothetical protein
MAPLLPYMDLDRAHRRVVGTYDAPQLSVLWLANRGLFQPRSPVKVFRSSDRLPLGE